VFAFHRKSCSKEGSFSTSLNSFQEIEGRTKKMADGVPVPPNVTGDVPAPAAPRPTLQQSHEGEHHGDFGEMDVPITHATKVFALCAALNSCNLGFDIGVSTSTGNLIQEDFDLSDGERELWVGSLNFFAIFGALSSNYFSDRYGRRQTFIVAAMVFILGIVISALSPTFFILVLGRCIVGLGVGGTFSLEYIFENSLRKRIDLLFHFLTTLFRLLSKNKYSVGMAVR
jgi:hypothetical protein